MLRSECLLPSVTRSSRVKALHAVQKEVPATGRRKQNHSGGETLYIDYRLNAFNSIYLLMCHEVQRVLQKAMQIAWGNKNNPYFGMKHLPI